MADTLEFYKTCCKTDSYIEYSYVSFAPIHKFCDLKAIRTEISPIPSSTLNHPVEDPKEILFGLDGENNPSPIHTKDSHDNKEKEKLQEKPKSNEMEEVIKVVEKKQSESVWEVEQGGNITPSSVAGIDQIHNNDKENESEISIEQQESNNTWKKALSSSHLIEIDKIYIKGRNFIDPNGSIFENSTTNEGSNTKMHGENIEIPAEKSSYASFQGKSLLGINSLPTFTYSHTEAPTTLTYSPTRTPSHHGKHMYIPDQVNSKRERENLPPTNFVPRETQFQQERQDFSYPPQSPEKNQYLA